MKVNLDADLLKVYKRLGDNWNKENIPTLRLFGIALYSAMQGMKL